MLIDILMDGVARVMQIRKDRYKRVARILNKNFEPEELLIEHEIGSGKFLSTSTDLVITINKELAGS